MRGQVKRGLGILGWVIVMGLCAACASIEFEPSPPGPSVPRISNFRIEPREVKNGGQVTLRFDFRDPDGDIMDVYLGVNKEVKEFTLATGLRPTLIDRGSYFGQTEGTAEQTITVSIERRFGPLTPETRKYEGGVLEPEKAQQEVGGIRTYEVFVVDRKGSVSNHLRARVYVR